MSREEWAALADHWDNRARECRRRRDEAGARLMDAKAAEARKRAGEA